jgi:hypothetical protein
MVIVTEVRLWEIRGVQTSSCTNIFLDAFSFRRSAYYEYNQSLRAFIGSPVRMKQLEKRLYSWNYILGIFNKISNTFHFGGGIGQELQDTAYEELHAALHISSVNQFFGAKNVRNKIRREIRNTVYSQLAFRVRFTVLEIIQWELSGYAVCTFLVSCLFISQQWFYEHTAKITEVLAKVLGPRTKIIDNNL